MSTTFYWLFTDRAPDEPHGPWLDEWEQTIKAKELLDDGETVHWLDINKGGASIATGTMEDEYVGLQLEEALELQEEHLERQRRIQNAM